MAIAVGRTDPPVTVLIAAELKEPPTEDTLLSNQ